MDLYCLQSVDYVSAKAKITDQENIRFSDRGLAEAVDAPSTGPFRPDSDAGARLGEFLSRPVVISTFDWTEINTAIKQLQFNPWYLYFSDPGIKRKLDNFFLLRCKLRLKFVVNASPFYFGSMRVSYNPMSTGVDLYQTTADQIKLSQTPGLYLEPSIMTTSEMELPFLWPNAWLDATSAVELNNMGLIQYILFAKLRSANGVANAKVQITCYAWAEEVEVAGLTTALSLQSDEYEIPGPISGPASAVAGVAGLLKDVPLIGGMATAAEKGASMVSSVARAFGYSNPPVISDSMPFHPKAFHAFSSVDTSVPADKLTVDPKNEVTIDNAVAGVDSKDPLELSGLLSRESFVQGTLYQGANAPGDLLWSAPVTPIVYAQVVNGSQTNYNHTVSGYFGRLFDAWRGSMVYRFRFVKSRYHTGRLVITWDPHGNQGSDYETTTLTRVVDVQDEEEVAFVVPYKAASAWLNTTAYPNGFSNSGTPTYTYDALAHNGTIQLRVLNALTGPAASPQFDILCYVSCGEDFRFAIPKSLPHDMSCFEAQSQDVPVTSPISEEQEVELVTVGECVASLRPIIHRASFSDIMLAGDPMTGASAFVPDGYQMCSNFYNRVGPNYGFDPDAFNWANRTLSAGSAPFNFCANHPLVWIINAFAGYRGSTVHHFNVEANGVGVINHFSAERDDGGTIIRTARNARNRQTDTISTTLSSSFSRSPTGVLNGKRKKMDGQKGMALTNCQTQAALSVVMPQYSYWRVRPAYAKVRDKFPTGTYSELDSVRVDCSFRTAGVVAGSPWPSVEHYISAGVDFNPVYFVCAPTLYAQPIVSANDTF